MTQNIVALTKGGSDTMNEKKRPLIEIEIKMSQSLKTIIRF